MLGEALAGRKKFVDAEPLLLIGYEGLKARQAKIEDVSTMYVPKALTRLVKLYEATGNAEAATKWRQERDALKK